MISRHARPALLLLSLLGLGLAEVRPAASEGAEVWSCRAPMPAALQHMAAVVEGGKFYVFGGWSSTPVYDTVHASVYAYNPSTDAWATKSPMPTARHWATCCVVDGVAYVFGGETVGIGSGWTSPTAVVEAYDTATDTWTTKASMPTARWGATSQAVDGKIYVIGGSNAFADYAVTEIFDPQTNTWSTGAPMPTGRRTQTSALLDGLIYVVGGAAGPTYLGAVEAYDVASDSWSTKAPLPTPTGNHAMVVRSSEIVALGGHLVGDLLTDAVWIYDAVGDAWGPGTPLLTARGGHAAGLVDSRVVVAGGNHPAVSADSIPSVEALAEAPADDTFPPALSVSDVPAEIWPPNHKMTRIQPTLVASHDCDGAPLLSVSVVSSEPDDGLGDGDTAGDIVIHSPTDIELRAERSGSGPGRTYTLTWTATDASGNSATSVATVTVPRSK